MSEQSVVTARMPFIRSAHTEVGDGVCGLCEVVWPCDAGVVLMALEGQHMTPDQIEELRPLAESFSGLQYVVTESRLQWPWTSVVSTNQVVDLVRAIPGLLDEIARLTGDIAALREQVTRLQFINVDAAIAYREQLAAGAERIRVLESALRAVGYNDCCWCPEESWNGPGHAPECYEAQSALAPANGAPAAVREDS